ncbi:hypothetical protein CH352_11110 [Leptospira hartskeerlii]|uniref:Uncharacterized protein n=1 Tax=Leptospira hartskeerlii TaxID=2023177 RepID=A0A2M9XBM2_9LEPT|nr:hypothetical protein CH357_12915 [Leptospira hartskeerlii]PJZ33500.1 hypothetical protein CH352_11110 [Leptospira hartskeerlii]
MVDWFVGLAGRLLASLGPGYYGFAFRSSGEAGLTPCVSLPRDEHYKEGLAATQFAFLARGVFATLPVSVDLIAVCLI